MNSKRTFLTIAALLVGLAVISVLGYWAGKSGFFAPTPPVVEQAPEPQVMREIILYFSDPQAESLVPENREIPDCPDNEDCIRTVVEELLLGPRGDLIPVLPPQASLLAVSVGGDTATLDFSRDLVTRHPGGSISELLTVYALADTLAVNFPHLRKTRILVAGQAVESLKGHVDLRAPITADFRFTRPPERGEDNGPGQGQGGLR